MDEQSMAFDLDNNYNSVHVIHAETILLNDALSLRFSSRECSQVVLTTNFLSAG